QGSRAGREACGAGHLLLLDRSDTEYVFGHQESVNKGALTSSPPLKKGEDSYEAWFGFNQSTFGGFLFHRSALLRRISLGFTSGLPGPRSCDKRTIHQNLRLISPFSRTHPYGPSGNLPGRNPSLHAGSRLLVEHNLPDSPGDLQANRRRCFSVGLVGIRVAILLQAVGAYGADPARCLVDTPD